MERTAQRGGRAIASVGIGVGAVLGGRYVLEQVIATGGMGALFRGQDRLLQRPVAVKTLHPHLAGTPDAERFLREGRTVAALMHPNLVTIYDMGSSGDGTAAGGGLPYLVMEFIDGESLAGIIERAAPMAPAVGLPLAAQLCRGLAYAHEGGVVHRDIKPQNVLVTPAGQVKIVDFGIARGPAAHGLTEPGWVLGTAHYLAPEAAAGKPVGAAADLYAVGVVLFRLFTGRLPFVGDDPLAVAMLHRTAPPPLPSEVCPGLPPALEALLLQLLEKEPERRPASAAAVAATLADMGRSAGQQTGTAAFDEPTMVLPVEAGTAEAGDTTAFIAGGVRSGEVSAPAAPLPQRRGKTLRAVVLAVALLMAGGVGVWQLAGSGSGGESGAALGRVPATAGVRPGAIGGVNSGATGTAAAAGPVAISVADLMREVEGAAGAASGAGSEMEQLRQRAAALALAAQQRRERPREAADKLTEVRGKISDLVRRGELPRGTAVRLEGHLRTVAQALDEEALSATAEAGTGTLR